MKYMIYSVQSRGQNSSLQKAQRFSQLWCLCVVCEHTVRGSIFQGRNRTHKIKSNVCVCSCCAWKKKRSEWDGIYTMVSFIMKDGKSFDEITENSLRKLLLVFSFHRSIIHSVLIKWSIYQIWENSESITSIFISFNLWLIGYEHLSCALSCSNAISAQRTATTPLIYLHQSNKWNA